MSVPHLLYVCVSCRVPGEEGGPRHMRSGARLFRSLSEPGNPYARAHGFVVLPQNCFGFCSRSCNVALRGPGKPGYVLGGLAPGDEAVVVACALSYRGSPGGELPTEGSTPDVLLEEPPLDAP